MHARLSPDRNNRRAASDSYRLVVAFEIERKFLVRALDAVALAAAAADEFEIEQTYLRGTSEQSLRVRRCTRPDGSEERTETRKRRISARTREETERTLEPAEYRHLVERRDPSR
jgi:CYTH domain-containing protein